MKATAHEVALAGELLTVTRELAEARDLLDELVAAAVEMQDIIDRRPGLWPARLRIARDAASEWAWLRRNDEGARRRARVLAEWRADTAVE